MSTASGGIAAVDGRPALSGLRFHSDRVVAFSSVSAAASSGDTLLDDVRISAKFVPLPSEDGVISIGLWLEPQEGYAPETWMARTGGLLIPVRPRFGRTQSIRHAVGPDRARGTDLP